MSRHKKTDLRALLDRFLKGYSDRCMHNYLNFLAFLVGELRPKHILEIGTGDGWSARLMMQFVPNDGSLITIMCPGDTAEGLAPWRDDHRLDIVEIGTEVGEIDPVDLLYIQGGDRDRRMEWETWQDEVKEGAVVLVLGTHDPDPVWWTSLPYNTVSTALNAEAGFGMFIFSENGDKA